VAGIGAAAGAAVQERPFDPVLRADLAGLPAGRFLEDWLGTDDGQAMHLPVTGVPVLTYLQRDLAAGFRDSG
jgi:hypothetical protein